MWFKNLNVFKIMGLEISDEKLCNELSSQEYVPCLKHEESKVGWVSPFGLKSVDFCPSTLGCYLFSLKIETRKVPADTINEIMEMRLDELRETDPGANINNELKKNLKEEIKNELLPYAFSKYESINAYWDTETNYLIIDVSSRTKSENFVSAFKNAISAEFEAIPVQTVDDPTFVMNNWLINGVSPEKIEAQSNVLIRDIENDECGIKYSKQDLSDEKLKEYLNEDKTVSELEVCYDHNTFFVITEDFLIKSVKWDSETKQAAENEGEESKIDLIMSIFSTTIPEVRDILKYTIEECFGGEKEEE